MKPIPPTTLGSLESFNSGVALTPTTLKSITDILESDDCHKIVQTFEQTGEVKVPTTPKSVKRDAKTFVNLDKKAWQGGTTTVLTPSTAKTFLEPVIPTTIQEAILPEPIVQTNQKQRTTMQTRYATRSSNGIFNNNSNRITMEKTVDAITTTNTKRRGNTGGGRKRPVGSIPEESLSQPERERLQVRRTRNKEAAARCRKRRVDQTNDLQIQVDHWQEKKQALEREIRDLQMQKEDLQFILSNHCNSVDCRLVGVIRPKPVIQIVQPNPTILAVKSEPVIVEPADAPYILPEHFSAARPQPLMEQINKPVRPMSLGFGCEVSKKPFKKEVEGVAIETPSNGLHTVNFDSLISTGLTPVATSITFQGTIVSTPTLNTPTMPTCSNQQRSKDGSDFSHDAGRSLITL